VKLYKTYFTNETPLGHKYVKLQLASA